MRIAGITTILLMACVPALADFGPDGPDPRGLAMGGAMASQASGPASVFWNPALLSRGKGISALASLGSIQRPDYLDGVFGGSERFFIGADFIGGSGKGSFGRYGLAVALEKPFPRFSYTIERLTGPAETSSPSTISTTVSQSYMELLIGSGACLLDLPLGGPALKVDAGLSVGLGFSYNNARALLAPVSAPASYESDSKSAIALSIPGAAGICVALESRRIDLRLAVRYRGVMPLSNSPWLTLGGLTLDEMGLFMPPPQQGAVGLGVTFFRLLTATVELAWNFFDVPDFFPGNFAHHYPTWKLGFEYRVPYGEAGGEFALRTGLSRSLVPDGIAPSIYASDSSGFHVGWGFTPDGVAKFDLFLSVLMLTGRRAGRNYVSAGLSFGLAF